MHPQHVNKRPAPIPPGLQPGPGPGPTPPPPPAPKTKRYYGRVELDAQRIYKDLETIVDEVLQHLTSLTGADVEVTLEINARRKEGFDDQTVRTVSENSRTLKFDQFGFEKD